MRSSLKNKLIIWAVLLVILGLLIIFALSLRISNVNIKGNKNYSDKQIESLIFKGSWSKNPFVFYFNTKFGTQEKIPFVTRYDVKIQSLTSVKIVVYEKKVIGYISYMGTNMYFDKDGIITESSTTVLDGVPKVTGISFDYIVLHEKLPVEDDKLFDEIMNLTQLLDKYELLVDKIYIADNLDMTLYIKDVKILLGNAENLNEKIIDLNDMNSKLEGMSGTLDMSIYDANDEGYTFKRK